MPPPQPTKTIAQVFEEFLADQKLRWSPTTCAGYADIINLFTRYLEGYWPGHEQAEYDRITKAGGTYCGTFGPEEIPFSFSGFLDYFMPRKVIGSNETMKAAGRVIKKLSKWLVAKGYVEDSDDALDVVSETAKDLPASQKLLDMLEDSLAEQVRVPSGQRVEGHFWTKRVEPGQLWLEPVIPGDREIGPFAVSPKASRIAKVGWDIGGSVAKTAEGWRFLEVWNVSP
jgi:hypothetical protein